MTIGIDAHKRSHTAVVLNEVGAQVASATFGASHVALAELYEWAQVFDQRRWAVEDCRDVTVHLEEMLVRHEEVAVRVPPALTGQARKHNRTSGKSDPIDAAAVAAAALAHPDLPLVTVLSDDEKLLKRLVDYRDQTVSARTELISHVRVGMSAVDPSWDPDDLTSLVQLRRELACCDQLEGSSGDVLQIQLIDLIAKTETVNKLELKVAVLVEVMAPELLEIEGVGSTIASQLIVRVGDINRFETAAKFAMYTGCAPIPASSGNRTRMRLNRKGNRQLNSNIWLISVSQTNCYQPAQQFLARKLTEGHTKKEARRALKTHIAKRIYNVMREAT